MNPYPLLTFIALFSTSLPLCVGVFKISRVDRGMKILFLYLVFNFAANIYLMWFARGRQVHIGFTHVYYLVEYLLIMIIMYNWLESRKEKRFFQALILFYILFWTIAKVTFEPLNGLYSYIGTISQILLTSCAEYTLFLVVRTQMQPIINLDRFWVLLSFVIYYAGTLFTIASRGILIHFPIKIFIIFASIDWSLKIIFDILFTIGFLCPRTRT
jgi:glycosyltransferase involved in cell wall biosynthesis